jgi:myo-inositol-1(or 4)-monophosphatase
MTPVELRDLAIGLAHAAGTLALDGRRTLGIGQPVDHDTKSSLTDPVTEFDRAAEQLLVRELRRARPHDAIVGEEGASRAGTSGLEWHLDPIDGTVNFVYDLPAWCTSVAVVDRTGHALAGAVYAPVTDEMFAAGRGAGATRNGAPIGASRVTDLAMALVATGFNYSTEIRGPQAAHLARMIVHVRDIRRFGSAALDLCMVACGRLDAYFEEHLNSWDIAAGVLIAAEAGARTSDFDGDEPAPAQVVAAAPGIHSELLELIAAPPD